jgi:hypothetical protein
VRITTLFYKRRALTHSEVSCTIAIGVFCCTLFFLGYPYPNVDDLVFVGAALNFFDKGQLANPLLQNWSPGSVEHWFVHVPFYSWLLVGWLWFWTVGARSLLLFQCLCYATASLNIHRVLRSCGVGSIASLGGASIAVVFLATKGFRPEALSAAFLAAALGLLRGPGIGAWGVGYFLFGCSILALPQFALGLTPCVLAAVAANVPARCWRAFIRQQLLVVIAAMTAVFLVLLLSVDFQLGTFLAEQQWHAWLVRPSAYAALSSFVHKFDVGFTWIQFGPSYGLASMLLGLTWTRAMKPSRGRRAVLLAAFSSVALSLVVYAKTAHFLADYFVWLSIILLVADIQPVWLKRLSGLAAFGAFLAYQATGIVDVLTRQTTEPSRYAEIRSAVRVQPDKLYAIDETSARFVFDFHLPANSRDWLYLHKSEAGQWPRSVAQKPSDMAWIISPTKKSYCQDLPDYERATFLGRRFGTVPLKPFDVILIE